MSSSRQIGLLDTLVATLSTSAIAIPAGAHMRSSQVGRARGDIEIVALNGNIQIAIGFQLSDDLATWTDETMTLTLGFQSVNGMAHASSIAHFTSTLAGKQYVRPVYYVKLSSGNTLATAFVRGSVDVIPRC